MEEKKARDMFVGCANKEIVTGKVKMNKKAQKKQKQAARELARETSSLRATNGNTSGLPPIRVRHDRDTSNGNLDIVLENVSVSGGGKELLLNASLQLNSGQKYGLIGRNGIGKTTFLTALAKGEFEGIPSNIQILAVEQEISGISKTPLDYVLETDLDRTELLQQKADLIESKEEGVGALIEEVQEKLEAIDAFNTESKAVKILQGLGFNEEMRNRPTSSLSGGWRMRVALARALFVRPDVLLLDEPTNHLDLDACIWLEEYVISCPITVVIVSHDRSFLNAVCDNMIHLQNKLLNYYNGNYDTYIKTRTENELNHTKLYTKQHKEVVHMQEFIDKHRATKQLASLVQSRIKALEKMTILEPIYVDDKIEFKFPDAGKCPSPFLELEEATFGYKETEPILKNVTFCIGDETRIALVGPNGAGKSTLLKMLLGKNEVNSGFHRKNPHCRVAVFNQHHMDGLDLALNPCEQLGALFPGQKQEVYRSHCSAFGISDKLQLTQIKLLSGGQKSRVALSIAAWHKPHLIVLDEPTNHLDIDAVQALSDALNKWEGGLLVVSHDEHFISNVCQEIFVVRDHSVNRFRGNFEDYRKLIKEEMEAQSLL